MLSIDSSRYGFPGFYIIIIYIFFSKDIYLKAKYLFIFLNSSIGIFSEVLSLVAF